MSRHLVIWSENAQFEELFFFQMQIQVKNPREIKVNHDHSRILPLGYVSVQLNIKNDTPVTIKLYLL